MMNNLVKETLALSLKIYNADPNMKVSDILERSLNELYNKIVDTKNNNEVKILLYDELDYFLTEKPLPYLSTNQIAFRDIELNSLFMYRQNLYQKCYEKYDEEDLNSFNVNCIFYGEEFCSDSYRFEEDKLVHKIIKPIEAVVNTLHRGYLE